MLSINYYKLISDKARIEFSTWKYNLLIEYIYYNALGIKVEDFILNRIDIKKKGMGLNNTSIDMKNLLNPDNYLREEEAQRLSNFCQPLTNIGSISEVYIFLRTLKTPPKKKITRRQFSNIILELRSKYVEYCYYRATSENSHPFEE